MLRYSLLVILRSILAVIVLFAVVRLVRRTWSSFWEGFRGSDPGQPIPRGTPSQPKIPYGDVKEASFKEEQRLS